MSLGWSTRLRVILALFVVLTASPLVSAMETGTPEPDPGTISEEVPPAEEPPAGEIPPTDPAPTDPPVEPTEIPATEAPEPTLAPTEEPTALPTEAPEPTQPAPTATTEPTVEPTATLPDAAASSRSGPSVGIQEAGPSSLLVVVQQCEDNDRLGQFEFMPMRQSSMPVMASNTAVNCVSAAGATITATPLDGGAPSIVELEQGQILMTNLRSGTYTVSVTIGADTGVSAELEFPAYDGYMLPVLYFIEETPQPEPGEGVGSVEVVELNCNDPERVGDSDFIVGVQPSAPRMQAASGTTECEAASPDAASFTLTSVDDPGATYTLVPGEFPGVSFTDIPSGSYTLTADHTGAVSEPFTVTADVTTTVNVVTFVGELPGVPVFVIVEQLYCEDDDRAGQTDFVLSGMVGILADTDTCYAHLPGVVPGSITITFRHEDTGEEFPALLDGNGNASLENLPPGTYTITRSTTGLPDATSDPVSLSGPTPQRLQVITYTEETGLPAPGEGRGRLTGSVLFCESSERNDGDVDFIIDRGVQVLQATSECTPERTVVGQVTVYDVGGGPAGNVDSSFDPGSGSFEFWLDAGEYQLGYQNPVTQEVALSDPFIIQDDRYSDFLIHVYSDPVHSGRFFVEKLLCVDPDRAGETAFRAVGMGSPDSLQAQANTTVTCRDIYIPEVLTLYTLEDVDSGRTWEVGVVSSAPLIFSGIPSGTYTLTETAPDGGSSITSPPFVYEASLSGSWITVTTFIAEADWEPREDGAEVDVRITALLCVDPERAGDSEYYVVGNPGTPSGDPGESAVGDLTQCRPAVLMDVQGLVFEATPTTGDPPIDFGLTGTLEYMSFTPTGPFPAGEYVITETTSGASTGPLDLTTDSQITFVRFYDPPESDISFTVRSSDPSVADTLPEGATWAMAPEGGETPVASGTLTAGTLTPPQLVDVQEPLPYGDYTITVSAGPAFEPFSRVFTVDAPTETFDVQLIPDTRADVTFTVSSIAPDIANTLPDDATWLVSLDGNVVGSGEFAPEQRELPTDLAFENLPFGTYLVMVNAGPTFHPFGLESYTVDERTESFQVELEPVTEASVEIDVVSDDPAVADVLPDDASWSVTLEDGTPLDSGVFLPEHRQLPVTIPVTAPVPFGTYLVTVDAGHTFEPYGPTPLTVDTVDASVEVRLVPVTEADVTLTVASTAPEIANTLPDDATWTVTLEDGTPVDSDTFAPEHRQLPAEIPVTDPVPFGTYLVTVDAGPTFAPYGPVPFTVDAPTEAFQVELEPVTEADVTITVSSADPALANILPEDASWSVTLQDGTPVDRDTFAPEHLALPSAIPVTDPVPFGTYLVTVDAGPTFEPYGPVPLTVDELTEAFDLVLIPVELPTELVDLELTSADPTSADRLPEGATWSITSVDVPDLVLEGTFPADQLDLPVTIPVGTPLPHGAYLVTVDATPAFLPYEATFTVGDAEDDAVTGHLTRQGFLALQQAPTTWAISLQPAPVDPTPEPTITPDPTVTPDPTGTPDPAEPTVPATPEEPTATPKPGSTISSLPNTGQGANGTSAAGLLLLTATVALVASIGGIVIRRNWT